MDGKWAVMCLWQGILLSGPPGTGKTLFARTLAKESGLPFVFASGAEFTDSEKSGAARINEMFSIARRNVTTILLFYLMSCRKPKLGLFFDIFGFHS